MNRIQLLWDNLPKECKVGIYLIGSGLIGSLVPYLQGLQLNSDRIEGILSIIVVNLALVFLVEAKKRIDILKK